MSRFQAFACVLGLTLATPVLAASGAGECPAPAESARLEAFRDRIERAESPAAARRMALDQTGLGHEAIKRAARSFPGDPGLVEADAKLSAFEEGVRGAETQQEVASQFDTLAATQAASCDYSGVEILIIVIGFIFGIIPGIIFLFLFC